MLERSLKAKRGSQGFTLIELIIVVFLLAIFAAIAVPGFSRLIDNNRTQAVGNELLGLLQYARGYAVENRANASVCMAEGQFSVRTSCEAGGEILRVLGNTQGVVLDAEVDDVQFRSNGAASGAASYTVCHEDNFAEGFTVSVAPSGQVRIFSRGQNSDGAMDKCDL